MDPVKAHPDGDPNVAQRGSGTRPGVTVGVHRQSPNRRSSLAVRGWVTGAIQMSRRVPTVEPYYVATPSISYQSRPIVAVAHLATSLLVLHLQAH